MNRSLVQSIRLFSGDCVRPREEGGHPHNTSLARLQQWLENNRIRPEQYVALCTQIYGPAILKEYGRLWSEDVRSGFSSRIAEVIKSLRQSISADYDYLYTVECSKGLSAFVDDNRASLVSKLEYLISRGEEASVYVNRLLDKETQTAILQLAVLGPALRKECPEAYRLLTTKLNGGPDEPD